MIESLANFILGVMNLIANSILVVIKSIAIVVGSGIGFALRALSGSMTVFFDAVEKQSGITYKSTSIPPLIPISKWERMTGEPCPPPPQEDGGRPRPTSPPPPFKKMRHL